MHRRTTILLCLALSLCLALLPLSVISVFGQTPNTIARPWQVHSFFDDADLAEKTVTFADTAPDGSLWLAVSDGLYHFDGYRWSRYTTDHGLPSNYVRCVLVASDGRVWIGTDRGAGTFDGVSFDSGGTAGNLAGPSVRRIVEDPDGSLWFCCDQWPRGDIPGGLTRLENGRFTTWRRSDGLPSDYVSDYVRDSKGRQFVLTNQGLAQFTDEGFRQPLKDAGLWDVDTYVWSLVESNQHGLIVSTDKHFFQFEDGRWRRIANSIPALTQPKLVAAQDGEVYTCTPGRGPTIYHWTADGFVPGSRRLTDITGGVDVLFEDAQGAIWIAGFERLLRWERVVAEWVIYGDVGAPIHKDRAGGIWFAAANDGLVRFSSGRWTEVPGVSTPIREDRDGGVWMQSASSLAVWKDGQLDELELSGVAEPRLLDVDGQGIVWASAKDANGSSVIAGFDGDQWTLQDLLQFANRKTVCRAVSDPHSGLWVVFGANRFPPFHLVHIDRGTIKEIPLPDRAQISDPPKVRALKDGRLLVGGFFGLLEKPQGGGSWIDIETPSPSVGQILELNGEVWVSCRGHLGGQAALVRQRDGVWKRFLDRQGEFVGRDGDKQLFVSSHGQIQIVAADVDTFAPPIATTPFETPVSSVVAGDSGEYWVGVGNRAYRYIPDPFPPETEIVAGDRSLHEFEDLVLRVRGLERFKPTGLDRNYLVSTQLDGGAWTPFQTLTGEVRILGLELGDHSVRVRLQNAARQIDATPAAFQYRVSPVALQSRPWFRPAVLMCFVTMFCLAVLAVLNWTRAYRLARGLEREVARKTSRLASSEREFRLLFEDSQDAICLFGTDGNLQSCNSAARDLLGLSAGHDLAISGIFADGNEETRFQHDLQRKRHLRGARYRIRTQNQDVFDAILSVNTRTDESGHQSGYQIIIRDISTLVDLQKRLSETKKMEAVGRMAGGIAHDFNNFLAVVMYGADFVKLNAKQEPGIEKGVQMILDAAERGRNLTSQIQTFGRAPTAPLDIINTHAVLVGIPNMLRGVVTPNVELVSDIADNVGHIRADQHQLEQIIINLAVNACHAMPEGGTLTIRASNIDIDDHGAAELRVHAAGPHVLLEVRDTGAGMDASTLERIFDPFFTTKPQGQGTGLGLAIVYGIIQQFRGQIQVDSNPGHGTCFEIYFPICEGEGAIEKAEPRMADPASGTETILLVEDEASIRELVRSSLSRYGYNVRVAEHGSAAKKLIETNGDIDLVVSDIVMPGTTGFDLIKWLRATQSNVNCLLISGYADPIANGELDDFDVPFLKKPFHPTVLAARVREILDSKVTSPEV